MVTGPEPLSPEDAALWCATTPGTQLLIGALCRFEGPPLRGPAGRIRRSALRGHVASRLHLIPRFRQRLEHVPLDLARPVWVDDPDFDLRRHLRTATLPAPGGDAELRAFVGDLLDRPLDPEHPMWDLWLLDGLDTDEVAVVLRADHVLADGLSLLNAAVALLDLDPVPPRRPPTDPWRPRTPPRTVPLAVRGLLERSRQQARLVRGAARAALDPRVVLGVPRTAVRTALDPPRLAPSLPITGRVGTRRDFVWTSLPLAPLRAVARSHGATLNDVVLAAVTGALRRQLGSGAASLGANPPKVLVPVADSRDGVGGNTFSFVVAGLPVHLADPGRVLDEVHREMQVRKSSGQSERMMRLFSTVDVVPIPLLRSLAPALLARQPLVNLAVTNLPGSEAPLHLLGARLIELHPIVSGVGNIACIFGVLSYLDRLDVGLTVDRDVVADAEGLVAALVDASEALIAGAPNW